MPRLIDANALKKRILEERDKIPLTVPAVTYELVKEKANSHGNAMRGGIRIALRCMEQTPSVDAVEVVRCKDCQYKEWDWKCPFAYHDWVEEDGYCHWGVKKNAAD